MTYDGDSSLSTLQDSSHRLFYSTAMSHYTSSARAGCMT